MKQIIIVLLAVCLCIGLCACSNHTGTAENSTEEIVVQTEAPTEPTVPEPETWSITKTVDEFGDVTEDSESVMQASFAGTFSNSATTDGELNGIAYILYNDDNSRSYVGFKLFEYGNVPVICSYNDSIVLKTKVGDTIVEYNEILINYLEQGTLFIGTSLDWMNFDGNQFIDTLCNGKDIRCIFYINNSEYRFTLESGNFKSLYDQPYVGKVQIPGAFVGEWEYLSGDATVFSRIASRGETVLETSNINITLMQETTTYGNHIPLVVKDIENNLEDQPSVTFTLDYIMDNRYINTNTNYVQFSDIYLNEDKTLVMTVTYYQGEDGMSYDELQNKLDDESLATVAVCTFGRLDSK